MAFDDVDPSDEMSPRERARLRNRDRKRTTTMVVDNAAVKRTAAALANRRAAKPAGDDPGERPARG